MKPHAPSPGCLAAMSSWSPSMPMQAARLRGGYRPAAAFARWAIYRDQWRFDQGVNAHVLTLNPLDDKMAAYRGRSFAVDLVRIDGFGSRARGIRPRNPSADHIFGDPLHAPCDGAVSMPRTVIPISKYPKQTRSIRPAITSSWLAATLLCSWRIFNGTALQWSLVRVLEREIALAQSELRKHVRTASSHPCTASGKARCPLVRRAAAIPTKLALSRSQ